jgi:hypothetical protein
MILASVNVGAATTTLIYSVDRTRSIQQITFCDRGGSDQNTRLWLVPFDTTLDEDAHARMYDRVLPANSTLLLKQHNITLEYGEAIWAYGSLGSLTVSVDGS